MKAIPLLLILLLFPCALAQTGRAPLLAVKLDGSAESGSVAELKLEIIPGNGRVFVDTLPLSRVDTQMSMRFAKEIACDYLSKDCTTLDFIYTITANSPIIGGPSAGASATVLTISTLLGLELPNDIAMTGTINSGGLVGPVGGLKEKTLAARGARIKMVLVPQGEHILNSSNLTLEEYGKSIGLSILPVASIQDALHIFFPGKFSNATEEIASPVFYRNTMRGLAEELCNRTVYLKRTLPNVPEAANFSKRADGHFSRGQYYAAASFCFGANIKFSESFMREKNFSAKKYEGLMRELESEIDTYEKNVDAKRIETLTDLESYMVVKERLLEARTYLNVTHENLPYAYAYANERLRSAKSWSQFLTHDGKAISLDKESLRSTCGRKIGEADERIQYLAVTSSLTTEQSQEAIRQAYANLEEQSYALCIFHAGRAKAEANILLTALGISTEDVPLIVASKLRAAAQLISKESKKGMFPILGYSYYEYATTLLETDMMSSMLYAEYALELSDLQMYFKPQKEPEILITMQDIVICSVLSAFIIGFLVSRRNV